MDTVKLNIERVTDVIGNDYKKWKEGDIVKIQSQTGSGKTYFITETLIPWLSKDETMLILVNRSNLKLQMKKDLADKFNLEYKNTEELNDMYKFENIYIFSYQSLSKKLEDEVYTNEKVSLNFDYIVCDEIHMILADAWTGNTTCLWDYLIRQEHPFSIRIFISATMKELNETINKCFEKNQEDCWGEMEGKKHEYETGIDYSYIDPYYFDKKETIIKHIIQDTSDDKWLIFVTNKDLGYEFEDILNRHNIKSEFIHSGKKSKEITNIIEYSKFNCKVLISTSCLDNGINLKDDKVKHIVIFSYDLMTFMQELGRVRFNNLDNVPIIKLYLPTFNIRVWRSKLRQYNAHMCQLLLLKENLDEFKRKFNRNQRSLCPGLFYLDKDNKWCYDAMRFKWLIQNINHAEKLLEDSKFYPNDCYILEQLDCLNIDAYKFCIEERILENMEKEKKVSDLEIYLNKLVGKRLYDKEQRELSSMIINELTNECSYVDKRSKKLKPTTLEKILRDDLNLNYVITSKREDKMIDEKRVRRRYIIINEY